MGRYGVTEEEMAEVRALLARTMPAKPEPMFWQSWLGKDYMMVVIPADIDAGSRDYAVAILGLIIRRLEGMEFRAPAPPAVAPEGEP